MSKNAKTADRPKYCAIIGALMDEHGETQQELASAIGVTRTVVENWLNNRSKLSIESLIKIAEHYGETTDYICGLSTARKRNATVAEIEGATGLSAKAVEALLLAKEKRLWAVLMLDSLLSRYLNNFANVAGVAAQAVSCVRLNRFAPGNPQCTTPAPILLEIAQQFGEKTYTGPEIPAGIVQLTAADAANFYKAQSLKEFEKFLDCYIEDCAAHCLVKMQPKTGPQTQPKKE